MGISTEPMYEPWDAYRKRISISASQEYVTIYTRADEPEQWKKNRRANRELSGKPMTDKTDD